MHLGTDGSPRTCWHRFAATVLVALALWPPLAAQSEVESEQPCEIDLSVAGQMRDVLSNVLMRALDRGEDEVRTVLDRRMKEGGSGAQLLTRVASDFAIEPLRLRGLAEAFRHINCGHEHPAREFARNVILHVVLHELGHALVREFDLPILGNEETLADAFATHYLTTYLPDRAVAVLSARVESLMIEASEVERVEWPVRGEHNSDARRAYQIAALAIAADPKKYAPVADLVSMSSKDRRSSADYGTEIHRSWRRILRPLWMPADQRSNEVRIDVDDTSVIVSDLGSMEPIEVLERCMRSFDWHSQVSLILDEDAGGASWSRSKRTITIGRGYVQRFLIQGMKRDFVR